MANNTQINKTSYYQLPCGMFLEDFIYSKGLNFNMGSALKYKWRAGHKDGESQEKDLAKCEHYICFEAECRRSDRTSFSVIDTDIVRYEIELLMQEAMYWKGAVPQS